MSDTFSWRKIKKSDFPILEKLLKNEENNYVNASAKFLLQEEDNNSLFWVLADEKNEIKAAIINWKNNILPVLCGHNTPLNDFYKEFLSSKKIHSLQGLKNEVTALEKVIKTGKKPLEIIDYHLMSLDTPPKKKEASSNFSNLKLITPKLADIDAIAPLQAEYEKEEVLPKGAVFSPASSRVNTANIIAKGQVLAAEIDGRFIGKINVSAVSFTRYQVGGVYVYPEYRGKGIAGAMTYQFISSLISQCKGVTLFARKANTAACRLYKSLGFKNINDYCIVYY
jgi:uncharacterized protein